MAETAAQYFVEFDIKQKLNRQSNGQSNELISSNESKLCMTATTTTVLMDRTYVERIPRKVVFNDGTAAGVLSNLKGCTRPMNLHEVDVTLKSLGLMLHSPADITPSRIDPFRSTLMTLHGKPEHVLRALKK